MPKRYAEDHSLKVGSPLTVKTPTGKTLRLHVDGIVDPPKGGSPFGEVSISTAAFDSSFADHGNELTFLNIDGGPSEANTAALEQSLAAFPAAVVETRDEFKATRVGDIDADAHDPLRAARPLGDRQPVRRHQHARPLRLRAHARARDAAGDRHDPPAGTPDDPARERRHRADRRGARDRRRHVPGVITTAALSQYGIVFAVPYGTLAVFVGVAILAGMLAAILPARRASKLNVLEALQYE